MKHKNYLSDKELTYEIIISQGKGKLTNRAAIMMQLMADNIIKKYNYDDMDLKYDCKQEALCDMLVKWNGFNRYKYDSVFPYLTEICKRSITKAFYMMTDNEYEYEYNKETRQCKRINRERIKFVSLSTIDYSM